MTVTDPCTSLVAIGNGPTIQAITVENGAKVTQVFEEAVDSIDQNNFSGILNLCGPRDYKIRVGSGANDALFGPASIAMNTP